MSVPGRKKEFIHQLTVREENIMSSKFSSLLANMSIYSTFRATSLALGHYNTWEVDVEVTFS
jgi:hypothetical protein